MTLEKSFLDSNQFAQLPRSSRSRVLGLLVEAFPDCHWLRCPLILSTACLRRLLEKHDGRLAMLHVDGDIAAVGVLRRAAPHPRRLKCLLRAATMMGLILSPRRACLALRR